MASKAPKPFGPEPRRKSGKPGRVAWGAWPSVETLCARTGFIETDEALDENLRKLLSIDSITD
jgi:hypothetical protein